MEEWEKAAYRRFWGGEEFPWKVDYYKGFKIIEVPHAPKDYFTMMPSMWYWPKRNAIIYDITTA